MGKKVKIGQFLLRTGKFKDLNEVLSLLKTGRVRIGDKIITSGLFEFRPSTKPVYIDSTKVELNNDKVYIAINKPEGVICQKNDAEGRPDVWLMLRKLGMPGQKVNSLVTIGRLDINTEGLLIMTNDGNLVNKLLQPNNKVEKEYYAIVNGFLTDDDIRKLESGIDIEVKVDGKREIIHTQPAKVRLINRTKEKSELTLVIHEGKKRQVRIMLFTLDHDVLFLRRIRIGKLTLGDLKVGQYREITTQEIGLEP